MLLAAGHRLERHELQVRSCQHRRMLCCLAAARRACRVWPEQGEGDCSRQQCQSVVLSVSTIWTDLTNFVVRDTSQVRVQIASMTIQLH